MKFVSTFPILLCVAALGGCDAPGEDASKKDQAIAEPTPNPDEPVSILRPEIEQPEDAEPAQPDYLRVTIGFPEGGDELDEKAIAKLKTVLGSERLAQADRPIILGGHSDAGGNDAANQRASRSRAEAVRDWLVENGVAKDRISIIAFGEQNPLLPNALPDGTPNEDGRAANRRVELEIPSANATTDPDGEDAAASPKVSD